MVDNYFIVLSYDTICYNTPEKGGISVGKLINSSVYSIIREEYSGRNISDAFVFLTKYVIKERGYRPFRIQEICDDFEKHCGFSIPYHPMTVIVGQLKKQGYLWEAMTNSFNPVKEKIDPEIPNDIFEKEQSLLDQLIDRFTSFAKASEIEISKEDAESTIDEFIGLNGIDLLRGIQDYSAITDNPKMRLFYSFYSAIEKTDPELVEYVGSLIVGRILTDLFISGQDDSIGTTKSNATVYLDTSVVFSLLGIDEIDHSKVYEDLISATQQLGMKVKVFHHTFVELITLIQGSEEWIGNPNFDPFVATASARFFVTHNYTKEDIVEFASNLASKLKHYQIEIDAMPYPSVLPRGVKTEKEYFDLIVEKYKSRDPLYDVDAKAKTIDKDARSLYFVDHLNAGIRAPFIQSISNVFITRNNALASIARSLVQQNTSEIPDCVNDIYWGTLIWLNNPQQLLSTTRIRVAANACATFLPSTQLKRKLVESAEKLVEKEEISPEEAYFLKTSSLAQQLLMEMTKGDDKYFTEKTTLDILAKIREDARLQGHLEEREIAKKEIYALQDNIKTLSEKMIRSDEKHQEEVAELRKALQKASDRERKRDIRELERKCIDISEALSKQSNAKEMAEKKYKRSNIFTTCVLAVFVIVSVVLTIILFRYGNAQGKDYLNFLSVVLNFVLLAITVGFHINAGKPLDTQNIISKYLQKKLNKKYKKYGYDKDEEDRLKNDYNYTKGQIKELSQPLSDRTPICV